MSLPIFASILGVGIGVALFVAYRLFNERQAYSYDDNSSNRSYQSRNEEPSGNISSENIRHRPVDTEKTDCIICLDAMAYPYETLRCNHRFHLACLEEWRKHSKCCPICRNWL